MVDSLTDGLKVRHLTMMGLGSAIGAGLFLGTGAGIAAAGPAVLLSYAIAGFLVVLVMRMLGEMAAASPSSGSFSTYAEMAFGRTAGFVTGWLYWFTLVMVMGAEMTGAAAFMGAWFGVDPWIPALVAMVVFAAINLAKVSNFGEFEFWFAAIKVTVIIGFLVIGTLLVFGLLPGSDPVGFANFTGLGGFAPNGVSGIAAGLLVVAFAFGGIEIVTIAAAESKDPALSVGRAVRSVVWRISVFYLGSILVITLLLPWNRLDEAQSAAESPFTLVLQQANFSGVVGFMEAIIVLSLLSAFNAQIYATSRMMYSLALRGGRRPAGGGRGGRRPVGGGRGGRRPVGGGRGGRRPAGGGRGGRRPAGGGRDGHGPLARVDGSGVPRAALLVSVFFGFVAVLLNYLDLDGLLTFLLNAVGASLLAIWAMTVASQLRLRRRLEAAGPLPVRMWAFPYLSWLALALLVGLTALMLTDGSSRRQVLATLAVIVVLTVAGQITGRRRAAAR
ncbi:amino acid permease [Rhodococcus sp. BP-349]|uniref:amino acid permease n=2 Tax=Rhodococcus TaxID=1827 RepID=UPI001DD641F0|nr:amino acid permease [Rhodococcus sp. BP-363]MBY6545457.1 amino acid permease [Rhodococcus sp. BP-369]MBY6564687.1 amino acid permease [Rhodococcus sp. BP-370]MBY6578377.1 amino acid permease [Rhodococcus sp. BP-364]MBY6587678.1 amino acid permease [Rhodococcus sp. BP-358]MBY6592015.1 amino acid permease [Rhodococcus sp. BP-362]MBY6596954.1 amino acid permease [Rhodococcus sp. BP-359]MBY6601293.1 amino acid permease [Rhodococcus sp. BP-353]MBY6605028.1 amino acid permease [Rhodococcus sp.